MTVLMVVFPFSIEAISVAVSPFKPFEKSKDDVRLLMMVTEASTVSLLYSETVALIKTPL